MMPEAKQEEYQMGQKDGQVTAYKIFFISSLVMHQFAV